MKRTVLLSLVCLAMAVGSLPAATISLLTPSKTVQAGSTFDVTVAVSGVFSGRSALDEVLAFGFNPFVGNSSLVQYLGATVSSPFSDDSALFGGTPQVAGSTFPGLGSGSISGPLTLAVLQFQALTNGKTGVGVTSDLNDFNQGLIYVELPVVDLTGAIDIQVIPEPSTYLLLAGSLAALVAARARRS